MAPNTYRKLQDKHVLVVGGSSGIGYAVAEAALADGARVTIASSTKARIDRAVETLTTEYGPSAVVQGFVCDLGKGDVEAPLEALFRSATTESPRHGSEIHHVVYTAANNVTIAKLSDVTMDTILSGAQMRMFAPIFLAKIAQRYLPKSSSSSLTFTSGAAGEKPAPNWAVTTFMIGGIQAMVKGLAIDLAPVRVNVVIPGMVKTELWKLLPDDQREQFFAEAAKKLPVGAVGQPEDVAEAYIWFMKDRFATGTWAHTSGGTLIV